MENGHQKIDGKILVHKNHKPDLIDYWYQYNNSQH